MCTNVLMYCSINVRFAFCYNIMFLTFDAGRDEDEVESRDIEYMRIICIFISVFKNKWYPFYYRILLLSCNTVLTSYGPY